jgi:hypothetical protein
MCLTLVTGVGAARAQDVPPAGQPVAAPPPAPVVLFGATLEGYFAHNANRPDSLVNTFRAYDSRTDSFALQQAAIVIDAPPSVTDGRRYGLRLDLQFGQAVGALQGNPANEPHPDLYRNVWQAYGTYVFPVGRGLTLDFGKFASPLGVETNYAKDDDHFTRALLFDFLPFYHMGARVSVPVGDRLTAFYMITNGAQQTEDFNSLQAHHGMVIVKLPQHLHVTASVYRSHEPSGIVNILDAQAAWTPVGPISAGLDLARTGSRAPEADHVRTLTGVGTYVRAAHGPWAAAVRYEWLDDAGGLFAGLAQTLQEITATGEWRGADGFLTRIELRRDFSDRQVFSARGATTSAAQTTITAGLVWWIGTKKGGW